MNKYEEKEKQKKERLLARSDIAAKMAESYRNQADAMADLIPLGQPILVGHHSEKRHRKHIEKMRAKWEKSSMMAEKAAALKRRALSVGEHGISSDNPDALKMIEKKVFFLEEERGLKKRINAAFRKCGSPDPDSDDGWKEIAELMDVALDDFKELRATMKIIKRSQPYRISNISSEIRRLKARADEIAKEMEKRSGSDCPVFEEIGDWVIEEDHDENRILLISETKPDEGIRDNLKRSGFRWSPSRGAWTRQLNDRARMIARGIARGI